MLAVFSILTVDPRWSQSAKPNIPLLRMMVLQENGKVQFQLLGLEGTEAAKIPHRFYNLSVHSPGGHSLWEVGELDATAGALKITYGVTPRGFEQTVPAKGPPPDLRKGVEYHVSAEGGVDPQSFTLAGLGSAAFVYQGH